jgi:hypothetical protein
VPEQRTPSAQHLLGVFTRVVAERCGAQVVTEGDAPLSVRWEIK